MPVVVKTLIRLLSTKFDKDSVPNNTTFLEMYSLVVEKHDYFRVPIHIFCPSYTFYQLLIL